MLQNPDKLKMRNLLITLRDPEMINDKDNFYPGQVKNDLVFHAIIIFMFLSLHYYALYSVWLYDFFELG